MSNVDIKVKGHLRRRQRTKKKLLDSKLPRLVVFRSNKHIYVQLVDDSQGKIIISASSCGKKFGNKGSNIEGAKVVGDTIGKLVKDKGIKKVCFDRNGYTYHGRIKALADKAREHLEF